MIGLQQRTPAILVQASLIFSIFASDMPFMVHSLFLVVICTPWVQRWILYKLTQTCFNNYKDNYNNNNYKNKLKFPRNTQIKTLLQCVMYKLIQ